MGPGQSAPSVALVAPAGHTTNPGLVQVTPPPPGQGLVQGPKWELWGAARGAPTTRRGQGSAHLPPTVSASHLSSRSPLAKVPAWTSPVLFLPPPFLGARTEVPSMGTTLARYLLPPCQSCHPLPLSSSPLRSPGSTAVRSQVSTRPLQPLSATVAGPHTSQAMTSPVSNVFPQGT